jgi:hypothetical protein
MGGQRRAPQQRLDGCDARRDEIPRCQHRRHAPAGAITPEATSAPEPDVAAAVDAEARFTVEGGGDVLLVDEDVVCQKGDDEGPIKVTVTACLFLECAIDTAPIATPGAASGEDRDRAGGI